MDAAAFSTIIVPSNGDMARMNTIAPLAFARFKWWMSELPQRDPRKHRRDALQASVIEAAVAEYLPQWQSSPPLA